MLWADFRHSFRGLIRLPGFTIICMLTLALGIGATTSIFSAIYHTMLRPMPFEGGDRLAYVWMSDSASGMGISPSVAYLEAWRARLHSFDGMESYTPGEYTLLGGTEPELIKGAAISSGLPAMLGVAPILGRTFTEDETRRNGRAVAVLSEGLWKRRFGGTRNVLGKTLELADGKRYEIVGVMPNVFAAFESFQHEGQVWFPLRPDTSEHALHDVNVIAKLKSGVTPEAASAELGIISSGVKADFGIPGKWAPVVKDPTDFLGDTETTGLKVLFAAVGMVLLIGCANIAGLLLVRLNSRRREMAIRAAVGARRFTIIRLLMVESILIAMGGGALGLFLSAWITSAIRLIRPESMNSLDAITTDKAALLFALVLCVITSVFFGIAPIISAMRRDMTGGLINNAGAGGRVTSGNRMRSIMVGGQIALSAILLIASLLLVRSVQQLQSKDLGFDPKNVLTFGLHLRDGGSEATNKAFFDRVMPALRKLPGVTSASLSTGIPSKSGIMFGDVTVPGREVVASETEHLLGYVAATPEYMKTVGLRIVDGRFFHADETGNPVVINEKWAKKLWPGESAVGKQLHMGQAEDNMTIIGVVADVATMGAAVAEVRPNIYVPYSYQNTRATIALRTDGRSPGALAPAVRAVVHSADPTLVARDIATLEDLMADTIAMDRFYMLLLSSFATLALVLSVVGLYGVISNTVAQRTREIGVRMALGATPATVKNMVFTHAIKIVAVGLAVGFVAALALVRYLKSALHGFNAHDPVSFTLAIVVLTAGAMFATYIPARRAVRVDPLDALRTE